MSVDSVFDLFFGSVGIAIALVASGGLFLYTDRGFERVLHIVFRSAMIASSGAFGVFWLSLLWQNPPTFHALADYVLEILPSRWVLLLTILPVLECVALPRKPARSRNVAVGIDVILCVSHIGSVFLFVFMSVLFSRA